VAILRREWGPLLLDRSGAFIHSIRLLEPPVLLAALVVWYAVLLTDGPLSTWIAIPAAALAVTWVPRAREMGYRFAGPVLVACVAVPAIWSIVGLARGNHPSLVADHALHFVLFGLYFPMRWAVARAESLRMQLWLLPTLVLCGLSIALWLGHAVLHLNYGIPSPIFQTALALQDPSSPYRVFFKGDLFLIPAAALMWARISNSRRIPIRDAFALVVILGVAVITGTRGLWLAIAVAIIWAAYVRRPSPTWVRSLGIAAVVGALLLATPAAAYIEQRVTGLITPAHDVSTQIHITEANELLAAFSRNPVIGAGLGAILPSGLVRAPEKPYLYELTYHQMLFQLGVIGTLAFLAPIIWGIARGARLTTGPRDRRVPPAVELAAVGSASLLGLLIVSATNPYLFSAVGAVIAALALSLVDAALDAANSRPTGGESVVSG
jgi:hypothetical protein